MSSQPSGLTLYGHAMYRSFRNIWLLEELGVPYTHVPLHPRTKGAFNVNPFGKIPVLADGDFKMHESAAINTYLGDKYQGQSGGPSFVPSAGTHQRARYDQYVCCIMTELDAQTLWIHRKHEAMGHIFGAIPEAVEHAKKYFSQVLQILLTDLQQAGDYLLGTDFSAADILFVHCLDWAESINWLQTAELSDDLKTVLEQYLERCRQRPAYQRAVAKKGEKQGHT